MPKPKKTATTRNPAAASDSISTSTQPAPTPRWPQISGKEGLLLETLELDQILLLYDFLDPLECKQFVSFLEKQPLVITSAAKRGEADRVNDRISIQSEEFAKTLWAALGPYVEALPSFSATPAKACGFNPNIRLYRYGEGQYFGAHYDDSIRDPRTGWWSEWTLLVYLTGVEDGVEGGETVFFKQKTKKTMEEIFAPLKKGTALFHRHGKECMLHEGREVKAGKKLVLRSDLMFCKT